MSEQKVMTGSKLIESALRGIGAKGDGLNGMVNNVKNRLSPDIKEKLQTLMTLTSQAHMEDESTLSEQELSAYQGLVFDIYHEITQLEQCQSNNGETEQPCTSNEAICNLIDRQQLKRDRDEAWNKGWALSKKAIKANTEENKPNYMLEAMMFLRSLVDKSEDRLERDFEELEQDQLRRRQIADALEQSAENEFEKVEMLDKQLDQIAA